jgi:hypothetical protein
VNMCTSMSCRRGHEDMESDMITQTCYICQATVSDMLNRTKHRWQNIVQ